MISTKNIEAEIHLEAPPIEPRGDALKVDGGLELSFTPARTVLRQQPASAPNGKPKVPPLLHRKIKQNDSNSHISIETLLPETGTAPVSGSGKIPVLKSKYLVTTDEPERRSVALSRKRSFNDLSISGKESIRFTAINRCYERVKLPNGIQMKRIEQRFDDQPSKGPSSYSARIFPDANCDSSNSGKQINPDKVSGRKMKKVEATFTEVKSFSRSSHPTDDSQASRKLNKGSLVIGEPNTQTVNPKSAAPSSASSDHENEKMELGPGTTSRKKLYKSKFWDFIDPDKSKQTENVKKNFQKNYDPIDVQRYMQKQKQSRKIQQKKISKEGENNFIKRQQMLKDLDEKCQRIAAKRKRKTDHTPDDDKQGSDVKPSTCNLENELQTVAVSTMSSNLKYFKPLLTPKQVTDTDSRKSEVAKQSQFLLSEFESIVKRECISFLQNVPSLSQAMVHSEIKVDLADKSVGTDETHEYHKDPDEKTRISEDEPVGCSNILAPTFDAGVEGNAAKKIQAAFRGHKIRQALKEAGIILTKSSCKFKESGSGVASEVERTWKIVPPPKLPEKPYDRPTSATKKLVPLSPIPTKASSHSLPSYIPLHFPTLQSHIEFSTPPSRIPAFSTSPGRIFNEPYPKGVGVTTTSERHLSQGHANNVSFPLNNSCAANLSQYKPPPHNLEYHIPSAPSPSVIDAFRAKVRACDFDLSIPNNGKPTRSKSQSALSMEKPEMEEGSKSSESTHSKQEKLTKSRTRNLKRSAGRTSKHTNVLFENLSSPCETSSSRSITNIATDVDVASQKTTSSSSTVADKSVESAIITSDENFERNTLAEGFLGPALMLRYEAEKEHLHVLEKALQVKLKSANKKEPLLSQEAAKSESKNDTSVSKMQGESERVQLAIANCQKESMKAAAEMAKWMSDFQKATQTQVQERNQFQNTSIDMAAMVYAAVEQIKRFDDEMRRDKKQEGKPGVRENDRGDQIDKSTEVSLGFENASKFHLAQIDNEDKNLVSYQQLFPPEFTSVGSRSLPLSTSKEKLEALSLYPVDDSDETLSKNSSPDLKGNLYDCANTESLEYASLIPSGNTVEISSLGHAVSSVDGDASHKSDEHFENLKLPPPIPQGTDDKIPVSPRTDELRKPDDQSIEEIYSLGDDSIDFSDNVIPAAEVSMKNQMEDFQKEDSPDVILSEEDRARSVALELSEIEVPVDTVDSRVESEYTNDKISSEMKQSEGSNLEADNETTSEQERYVYEAVFDNDEEVSSQNIAEAPREHELVNASLTGDMNPQSAESSIKEDISGKVADSPSEPALELLEVLDQEDASEGGKINSGESSKDSSASNPIVESDPKSMVSGGGPSLTNEEKTNEERPKNEEIEIPETVESTTLTDEAENAIVGVPEIETVSEAVIDDNENNVQNISKIDEESDIPDVSVAAHPHDGASESHSDACISLAHESEKKDAQGDRIALTQKTSADSVNDMLVESVTESTTQTSSTTSDEITGSESIVNKGSETPIDIPESDHDSNEEASVADTDDQSAGNEEKIGNETPGKVDTEGSQMPAIELGKETEQLDITNPDLELPVANVPADKTEDLVSTTVEAEPIIKQPPPYSPPSSLESTSLSSRSLMISLEKRKVEKIVRELVEVIWPGWKQGDQSSLGDIGWIKAGLSDWVASRKENEAVAHDRSGHFESVTQSFDILLNHLIYENIKDVLQVECRFTSFIDRVRLGPLALQAQKLRVPRTKEDLITATVAGVYKSIPENFFTDTQTKETDKSGLRKRCTRSRELVDEILLEEFVKEENQWTEWWPEEVIVINNISTKLVRNIVRNVVKNRTYVFPQH